MNRFFSICVTAFFIATAACASHAEQKKFFPVVLEDGGAQHRLMVEIADDPAERSKGLQKREYLPEDHGMLFDFGKEQRVSFWMKDTPLSLDILFFTADGTLVDIIPDAVPESRTPLRPAQRVRYVLEIGGGVAEKMKIAPGAHLILPPQG